MLVWVPVQSIARGQVETLDTHLRNALSLTGPQGQVLRELADQLDGSAVLPVLGAGASFECGVITGVKVSEHLYDACLDGAPDCPTGIEDERCNLGAVADAIVLQRGTERAAVDELGLEDENAWPGPDGFREHFCAYRVLARLAREDILDEATTFNYDCALEDALRREGFVLKPRHPLGRRWRDEVTTVSDAETNARLQRRGQFVLSKVHGCAHRYRELLRAGNTSQTEPWRSIIIRWTQLLDWRRDQWARDAVSEKARRNVLLLIGFSGQDPVIHIGLTRVLEDIRTYVSSSRPRVVVIDPDPDTLALRLLARAGLGGSPPSPGEVAKVRVDGTTTATLLVLLTHIVGKRLAPDLGSYAPRDLDEALALYVLNGPAMARWTFILDHDRGEREWGNNSHMRQAPRGGYVPLTIDPSMTSQAVRTRMRLLQALGRPQRERALESHEDGFVRDHSRGKAYMPVALSGSQLRDLQRCTGDLDVAARVLGTPKLDGIVVVEDGTDLIGLSIAKPKIVSVP